MLLNLWPDQKAEQESPKRLMEKKGNAWSPAEEHLLRVWGQEAGGYIMFLYKSLSSGTPVALSAKPIPIQTGCFGHW